MKNNFFMLVCFCVSSFLFSQVGINTSSPETTFEVAGKADDINHYDGILPPRITGDKLQKKNYTSSKKGTIVFVTEPPENLSGQVINIVASGMYYFDGILWQSVSEQNQKIEYRIILTFDENNENALVALSKWSPPVNLLGDPNTYLTSTKYYSVGTKNLGGLKGSVTLKKIDGVVNVKFQISRDDFSSVNEDVIINISDIYNEMGYFPSDVLFLNTENPTFLIPIYLQNDTILIPMANLSFLTSDFFGETQGYSSWKKPHLK